MEIQMGGGVFELGNPEGRGAQAVLEIQVEGGGGSKNGAFRPGGVDFFWNNPLLQKNMLYFQIFHVINLFLDAKCIFVVWGSFVVSSYMLLNRIP